MTKRPLVSRATDRCSALQANATFATGCTAPIHPDLASRTPARFTQPPRDKQANPTPDGFVQVMRRHTVSNCATIVYKIAVDRQRRTSVGGRRYLSGPHLRACQQQAPLLWHPYALASQHWCGVPPTGRHTMFTHHPDPTPFVTSLTTCRRVDVTPHALAHALGAAFLSTRTPEGASPSPIAIAIAIDLNIGIQGRGAITFCCQETGISERRPLRAQRRSHWELTVATEHDGRIHGETRTPAFALTVALTPLLHPGRSTATRIGMSLHLVHEPWWPSDLTDTLTSLVDTWLRCIAERAQSTA